LMKQIEALQQERDGLREEVSTKSEELETSNKKCQNLESQLRETNHQNGDLGTQLASAQMKLELATASNENTSGVLKEAEQKMTSNEKEILAQQGKIFEFEKQAEDSAQKIHTLNESVNQLKHEKGDLKAEILKLSSTCESLETSLQEHKEIKNELTKESETRFQELTNLETLLVGKITVESKLKVILQKVLREKLGIDELNLEQDRATTIIKDQFHKDLQESRSEIEDLRKRMEDIGASNEKKVREINEAKQATEHRLKETISNLENRLTDLLDELKEEKEMRFTSELEIRKLNTRISEMADENSRLEVRLLEKQHIGFTEGDPASRDTAFVTLEEKLSSEREASRRKIEDLRHQIHKLEDDKMEIETTLKTETQVFRDVESSYKTLLEKTRLKEMQSSRLIEEKEKKVQKLQNELVEFRGKNNKLNQDLRDANEKTDRAYRKATLFQNARGSFSSRGTLSSRQGTLANGKRVSVYNSGNPSGRGSTWNRNSTIRQTGLPTPMIDTIVESRVESDAPRLKRQFSGESIKTASPFSSDNEEDWLSEGDEVEELAGENPSSIRPEP